MCAASGVRREAPRGAQGATRLRRRGPLEPQPRVDLEVERVAVAEIGKGPLGRGRRRCHARECAPATTGAQAFRRASVPQVTTPPAGYSGTPLPKKLGIKPGSRVLLDGAPDGFETTHLAPLPDGVELHRRVGKAPYDVVLAFRSDARTLVTNLSRDIARTTTPGRLWLAWPKKASGVATDLTGDVVREEGLAAGVVDIKVCAIDETWSGLAFVRRVADR